PMMIGSHALTAKSVAHGIWKSSRPAPAARAVSLSPPKIATHGLVFQVKSTGVARPGKPGCDHATSPVALFSATPPPALRMTKSCQTSADPAWPYCRSPDDLG